MAAILRCPQELKYYTCRWIDSVRNRNRILTIQLQRVLPCAMLQPVVAIVAEGSGTQ